MTFNRKVIEWGIAHANYFHCHDLAKALGCSVTQASQAIHQIRKQQKVQHVEKMVCNPNKSSCGRDHIVAIWVLKLVDPLGKTRYLVEGTPDPNDINSRHLMPLNFASLNDANDAGFVRSCVTKAAREGKAYCGYRWALKEAK